MHTFIPKMPRLGSYLVPGMFMCSLMPKETLPYSSKQLVLILFFVDSNARFRNSSTGAPLRVTTQPMFSPFLRPHSRTAFFDFLGHGFAPVRDLRTVIAFSSLSPPSPNPMFTTTFPIRIARMGFDWPPVAALAPTDIPMLPRLC